MSSDEIDKRDGDARIDLIARLLAVIASQPEPSIAAKAVLLRRLGMAPAEIALVLNTTSKTISVRLAESRRGKKKRK